MLSCEPRSGVEPARPHLARALLLVVCVLTTAAGCASARKQLPLNTPYPPVVQNALRCDVCSFMVTNALHQLETKREELHEKRLRVREDAVLEEVENMCVPFKDQGQWIRQVALQLGEAAPSSRPADKSAAATPRYHMNVGVIDYYSKCGRICGTVAALCEEWMDSGYMDGFSSRLVKVAQSGRSISDAEHRDAVFKTFCAPSPYCKKHAVFVRQLDAALTKQPALRQAIRDDKPEEIQTEEREMETMLHRLTREQGQSADVFSRDEIRRMKEAFLKGDKEELQAVDPTAFDLSDDEFSTLREYMRGEEREEPQMHQQRERGIPSDADDL
ncbi:hypothetical protein LSCM1_00598 [Leishmania martiniquensis]|uniref:DUF3456 domain-containing protein n=1 Tax=Leishmania martiniquensis TaxID=1580590 RepID=A0A836GUL3_9TRYP|nr:hypothetical protein LSCM1_00598 [Leishmania martiniquensis]